MELKLQSPYEPLDLIIGDREVSVMIDVTPGNLIDLSADCSKAMTMVQAAQKLAEESERSNDTGKLKESYAKIAKAIEKPIVTAIGQDGYDEIRSACGGGKPISKEKCNLVMMPVFMAVFEASFAARSGAKTSEKAAHYLSEAEDAQPKPYTED